MKLSKLILIPHAILASSCVFALDATTTSTVYVASYRKRGIGGCCIEAYLNRRVDKYLVYCTVVFKCHSCPQYWELDGVQGINEILMMLLMTFSFGLSQ